MIAHFTHQYAFLSNFYPSIILPPTLEHHYQAAKTFVKIERLTILKAETPGRAKRLGAKCTLRPDWELIKLAVMSKLVREKFSDPELKSLLLATGDQELIEGNHVHDNFWGSCLCPICQDQGENHLGKILMKTRQLYKLPPFTY